MKYIYISLLFVLNLYCYPQQSVNLINYYSPKDYGKGLESTNRACVQDNNGIMYFGNAGYVLQFDGNKWNKIPVKKKSTWIISLAVSKSNDIYVGSQNEFGYLKYKKNGELEYISISDNLPKTDKNFNNINRIFCLNNKIIFQSEEAIFIYQNNKIKVIEPKTTFHLSFVIDNVFYVKEREIGLLKLSDNEDLQLLKNTEKLKNTGIFSILKQSDNELLIFSRDDGFMNYNSITKCLNKINVKDSTFITSSQIYGAIRLSDGNIALNTLNNGIIILNNKFEIHNVINKSRGLKDNTVLSLIEDNYGNIWAGLNNGIINYFYSFPIDIYNSLCGIYGKVNAIENYNSKIFIATSNGLFFKNCNNIENEFQQLYFNKEVKAIAKAQNCLIIGSNEGLYCYNNKMFNKIDGFEVNAMYYSTSLNLLFVASKNKVSIYSKSGQNFRKINEINNINEEIISINEDVENNYIWLGTLLHGVIRIDCNKNFITDNYYVNDGINENSWVIPAKLENEIVFLQRNNILHFINEKTIAKQLPDSLKDNPDFNRGYFDLYSFKNKSVTFPIYSLLETKNKVYANIDGEAGFFDKTINYKWNNYPFNLVDLGKINTFFTSDSNCWIGADDGLIKYKENINNKIHNDFKVFITNVSVGKNDSNIYSGVSDNYCSKMFNIDYDQNSIKFYFNSPFYISHENIQYSYMLEGADNSFSKWSNQNFVTFNNLYEGNYSFIVKAKNIFNNQTNVTKFNFTIRTPWYRQYWAYIVYFVFLILFIFIIVIINNRRLILKNKKLEKIIEERTIEIHNKNIVLQQQKDEILDSINYAKRIQNAMLPSSDVANTSICEHFVLFKPKDIVSGDFYWSAEVSNFEGEKLEIFLVADCTGHGVPGAFMSMLSISLLNEVILKEKIYQPDLILNKTRQLIIQSLKQRGISGEQKDGMDISMCVINKNKNELQYSGANNPLYIVRDKCSEKINSDKQIEKNDFILYEIKADGMPIAIYEEMHPFKLHSIKILKNDRIYLFSDGFADQFGGPLGKKFMYKNFKISLIETMSENMNLQENNLSQTIDNWIANSNLKATYEQIDDICVMGIKI